ncbi:MAG: polysaccharide biosynthesis protein [Sphingopyxis sp.]|nr:polysaccharide biosynthesis protein [Sphingopyxis sp.]
MENLRVGDLAVGAGERSSPCRRRRGRRGPEHLWFGIGSIVVGVALLIGGMGGTGEEARRATATYLAYAVSISGLVQLVWLYVWTRRARFTLGLRRPRVTPGVRELGTLIVPAVFGAGVYQISMFIQLFFIATLPDKSITFLAFADRLNQMPLGIIGIALGTAILPALSRFIAQDDADGASRLQSNAFELAMLLTVPAAVALFITGPALASAIYVDGAFTAADGLMTGAVVGGLVIGLPAYVLVKVLVPNYFARKDTRTPVVTAALSLVVNIALSFLLIPHFGIVGLAMAGSFAAWSNCAMLYAMLHRRGHYRLTALVVGRIAKIILAAAIMGAALWLALPLAGDAFIGAAVDRIVAVTAVVGIGGIIFFSSAWALGVVNAETIGQLRRRKA